MKVQAMVIGLGQFGMSVARALTARQVEVLAVDTKPERVRAAAPYVTEAVSFDATDEQALATAIPSQRDFCVCSIGDEAKEASIICTALLKQMGAKRVISRANDDLHARILMLVGATQVVNPEREFGERFVTQLLHVGVRGELPLGEGVVLTELQVPNPFVGRTLIQLELPRRFGVTVVAVRKSGTGEVLMPNANTVLTREDVMVVVAKERAVSKMLEKL